jgi:hypothetical protein
MYIKTIKFENFNGDPIERKYYFNLTKSDIKKWNLEENGGFLARLERIQNTGDGKELSAFIEELLSKTYGEKSDDGLRFMKTTADGSRNLYDIFKETNAYDVLFDELTSNEKAATDFINGVLPAQLIKEAEEARKQGLIEPLNIKSADT